MVCATELNQRNSARTIVSPSYNFVKVDGDKVTIQWEDRAGNNGLGGFTQIGKIYKQKLDKSRHNENWKYVSKIKCNARFEMYELIITIRSDGNAYVLVKRNAGQSDHIQLFGAVYPKDVSVIVGFEQELQSLKMRNFEADQYNDWADPKWTYSDGNFYKP